jgi:hypothetical protein
MRRTVGLLTFAAMIAAALQASAEVNGNDFPRPFAFKI